MKSTSFGWRFVALWSFLKTKHGQVKFPGLEPDDLARARVAMREGSRGCQEHAVAANSRPESDATWLLVALRVWKQTRSMRPICRKRSRGRRSLGLRSRAHLSNVPIPVMAASCVSRIFHTVTSGLRIRL